MKQAVWNGRKVALLLGVALIAGLLGILAHNQHFLRRIEQITVDARYQIRGSDPRPLAKFVIVGVESATFDDFESEQLAASWPFPFRYYARVINHLREAGAKVIAVDVQFTEKRSEPENDALIEAAGRAGNTVFGTEDVGPGGTTNILGGGATLREFHVRAAEMQVISDSDGELRRMPFELGGLVTFPVATAEVYTGRAVAPALFGGAAHTVPIDYAGPTGAVPLVSFSDVYNDRFPRGMFTGKIAIVGADAASLGDFHQTPISATPMPGLEVQANEAATVLAGIPLREAPEWVTLLLIVLLALIVPLLGMRLGTVALALCGVGVFGLWSIANQLAFDSGSILDFSDPAASLTLATAGTVLAGMWTDSRERRRLRNLFAAQSASIVEEVLSPSGPRRLERTSIIAGYRIEAPIARGGMGVVYRATQLGLERTVALKLIATERAQDPVFRARFKLESRLAASIEHVNVIPIYEAGEDDGLLFIAMRLVEGVDLATLLERLGPLEPVRAARLIGQLAGALDAAHAQGLVHRDVKPANVLLTLDQQEHVYLTDFGVAKHIGGGSAMTTEAQWVGTIDYLAPEQIRGDSVRAAADIYALACVLYDCLTGQIPFPRDNEAAKLWAHVNAPPPTPSSFKPDLPSAMDDVIARGMDKDPSKRFRTALELADACAAALGLAVARAPTSDSAIPEPRAATAVRDPHAPTAISDDISDPVSSRPDIDP